MVQRFHVLYGVFCGELVPFWGGDSIPFKATRVLRTYVGNFGNFFGGWKLCFSSSDPAFVAMSYGAFVLAKEKTAGSGYGNNNIIVADRTGYQRTGAGQFGEAE